MVTLKFSQDIINRLEQELKLSQKSNDLRLYKKISCLLMINEGIHFSIIAKTLKIHQKSVYNWLKRFMARQFTWLLGKHYKNRGIKPRLNKQQKNELYKVIENGPEAYGFDSGIWTTAMIVEVVKQKYGVIYSPIYMAKLLKSLGLSYQRAKFQSDKLDNEEHQRKRQEWDTTTWPDILRQAETLGAVILFGDEVSFAQWGSLSRTWAPKGKQPVVKTKGKRKGMKVFGAIEFHVGEFEYMECEGKFNNGSYALFLSKLLNKYDCPIILIEDGAKYHNGSAVSEVKEAAKDKLIGNYSASHQHRHPGRASKNLAQYIKHLLPLLSGRGDVPANPAKDLCAVKFAESAGNFLLRLYHTDIPFGLVIVERHAKIAHEPQHRLFMCAQTVVQVFRRMLFFLSPFVRRRVREGGNLFQRAGEDSVVTMLECRYLCRAERVFPLLAVMLHHPVDVSKQRRHSRRPFLEIMLEHQFQFAQMVGVAQRMETQVTEVTLPGIMHGNAFEPTQNPRLFQRLRATSAVYLVPGQRGGAGAMQPVQLALHPQTRLVEVRHIGQSQGTPYRLGYALQAFITGFLSIEQRAHAERVVEYIGKHLARPLVGE